MRNQVDLLGWDPKYILQNWRRVCTHNNKRSESAAISCKTIQLVDIWLAKNRVERCHNWHFELLQ